MAIKKRTADSVGQRAIVSVARWQAEADCPDGRLRISPPIAGMSSPRLSLLTPPMDGPTHVDRFKMASHPV